MIYREELDVRSALFKDELLVEWHW